MTILGSDALFVQLRAALKRTRQFGADTLGAPAWEPAAGSEAAREIGNSLVDAAGQPWGDRPVRTAYAAANLLMLGVLDNLGSVEYLLRDPAPVLGPIVLSRSTIEIASTAWWLMEPGIGAKPRVCRELVQSLSSARQAGEQAKSMLAPGPEQNDVLDQQTRVTKRATDLGLTVTWPKKFSPQVGTEVQPTATQQTANLLHAGLATHDPPVSVYKAYSAVAHGEFYGLMHFMTPEQQPDGTALLHWGIDLDVLDSTVQIAILAFRDTWHRINAVMGWDNAKHEQQWADDLDVIFNSPTPR